jgi:hypothetical protein
MRRKQLLCDLKEARRSWKLEEEAQDRTLWRTQFGTGYGPVARQTTTWLNLFSQTVGLPLQGRYLHTGQHKYRINAYTHQTSLPWVGLESTIATSEWVKIVHGLYCTATVTGWLNIIRAIKWRIILIRHVSHISKCAKATHNCNQKI